MTETIKNAVLRALEARAEQCKLEMELCTRASRRAGEESVFTCLVREQFSYWSGELATALAAHVAMQAVKV